VEQSMNGKILLLFPSPNGPLAPAQVRRNLLPGVEPIPHDLLFRLGVLNGHENNRSGAIQNYNRMARSAIGGQ
jgi:hypothetical protein